MQLIDESSAKVLLNGGDASDRNVFSVRRRSSSLEGAVNAIRDEMERRSALHRDRLVRVMGQHEYRRMKRRPISPRALPSAITPRASKGSEHIPTEDEGAYVHEAASEEIIVDAGRAVVLASNTLHRPVLSVHAMKRPCGKDPLSQCQPAHALG